MEAETLVAIVLLGTVLLRYALVAILAYALLPRGLECPLCGQGLVPIAHAVLDRLLPRLRRVWCLGCGWQGVIRRGTPPVPVPAPRQPSPPVTWT